MSNALLGPDDDGYNAVAETRHGRILYHVRDQYVGRSLSQYGEYSQLEAELFGQICIPGSSVIEIGANIGAMTLVLSRAVGRKGRVYAYEASNSIFLQLCATLALNSINNTEVFRAIVSDQPGQLSIAEPNMNATAVQNFSSFGERYWNNLPEGMVGIDTPVLTIDQSLRLYSVRLIKVDAEGMENKILKGASETIRQFRPFLHMANNSVEKSPELIESLRSLDYQVYWHITPLFNPNNYYQNTEDVLRDQHNNVLINTNLLCVPREVQITIDGMLEADDINMHPLKNPAQ